MHVKILTSQLATQFTPYNRYKADFPEYLPRVSWGRGEMQIEIRKSQISTQSNPHDDYRADFSEYVFSENVLRTRRGARRNSQKAAYYSIESIPWL